MSMNVAKATLMDSLKQLRIRWEKAAQSWDDEARRRFERDYLEGLEPRVIAAIKGLDHVTELAARVKRECGDDGPGMIA